VVVEESDSERSRVSQSFWTGGPGLTPIMLALGATALSFTPARRVMIGEGAHEAILLPTLLRQARKDIPSHTPLGFQIVGGLSEISATTASRLEEEAGTVLYVVDNDDGGRAAAAVLPQRVRDSGRVLTLGEGTDAECIEDFVAPSILVQAVDEAFIADGRVALRLQARDVPSIGRAKWLEDKLAASGCYEARTRLAQSAAVLGPAANSSTKRASPRSGHFLRLHTRRFQTISKPQSSLTYGRVSRVCGTVLVTTIQPGRAGSMYPARARRSL